MNFYKALSRSAQKWFEPEQLKSANRELKQAFLAEFSESPDNHETAELLQFVHANDLDGTSIQGLGLGKDGPLISDMLWTAFGETTLPFVVKEQYPELTDEAWNQVLRIAQVAVMAFEKRQ